MNAITSEPDSQQGHATSGKAWAVFLGLTSLLTIYRLWAVDHSGMSLFFDESQYWDWSRHMAWGYYSKPPMVAAEIWLSTHLFGSGVLGVKTVAMLIYPLTAVALVGLARTLWPGDTGVRIGWTAGGLFLTMPLVGLLGMVVSTDGPLLLCWTLAAWMLWKAQQQDRPLYWVLCGLAVGLGIMSKYTMAAFAITALVTMWMVPGPRRGLLRTGPWLAALAAALVVSPNIWWNIQNDFPTLQHTADITTKSTRGGGIGPALVFLIGQVAAVGPVAVFGAWWLRRRGTASVQQHYLLAMSLPLLVIAVLQALRADAHVNWAAPALIGIVLLLATRLAPTSSDTSGHINNMTTGRTWLLAALLSNLALTGLIFHAQELAAGRLPARFDILVRMKGWPQAYAQLAEIRKQAPYANLPVLADSRLILTQTAYHWRQFEVAPMAWNPNGTRQDHYQLTNSMPEQLGLSALYITDRRDAEPVLSRFDSSSLLREVQVATGPDRNITLRLYVVSGFKGYARHAPGSDDQVNEND